MCLFLCPSARSVHATDMNEELRVSFGQRFRISCSESVVWEISSPALGTVARGPKPSERLLRQKSVAGYNHEVHQDYTK